MKKTFKFKFIWASYKFFPLSLLSTQYIKFFDVPSGLNRNLRLNIRMRVKNPIYERWRVFAEQISAISPAGKEMLIIAAAAKTYSTLKYHHKGHNAQFGAPHVCTAKTRTRAMLYGRSWTFQSGKPLDLLHRTSGSFWRTWEFVCCAHMQSPSESDEEKLK